MGFMHQQLIEVLSYAMVLTVSCATLTALLFSVFAQIDAAQVGIQSNKYRIMFPTSVEYILV